MYWEEARILRDDFVSLKVNPELKTLPCFLSARKKKFNQNIRKTTFANRDKVVGIIFCQSWPHEDAAAKKKVF